MSRPGRRVMVLSSLGADSGCCLRALYVSRALARAGHDVRFVRPPRSWPLMLDMVFTLIYYSAVVLLSKADFFFCVKPYPNTLWPVLLKKIFSRRIRVGVDIDDLDYGYRRGLLPLVSRILQKPFPRFCDIVTCHNASLASFIPREFRVPVSKIWRLDQGVDFSVFDHRKTVPESEAEALRRRYGLVPGRTLVYTAHLNIAADLDEILEAFRIAVRRQPDLKLIVAGGGPMYAQFVRLSGRMGLAGATIFTGHIAPEKVREFMLIADHCLVYYKDRDVNLYRTSMKIRECLAMGKSVIANTVGDLAEFGRFTVRSGNGPRAFAGAILRAIRRKPGMNRAGLAYVRGRYDWKVIGRKFSARIRSLF